MQYQLIKSKRKTIAISFDRGGNLVVKAPWFVSDREVEQGGMDPCDSKTACHAEKEKRSSAAAACERGSASFP